MNKAFEFRGDEGESSHDGGGFFGVASTLYAGGIYTRTIVLYRGFFISQRTLSKKARRLSITLYDHRGSEGRNLDTFISAYIGIPRPANNLEEEATAETSSPTILRTLGTWDVIKSSIVKRLAASKQPQVPRRNAYLLLLLLLIPFVYPQIAVPSAACS